MVGLRGDLLRVQYFVFEWLFVCSELACVRAQICEEAPLAAFASPLSVYSGFVVLYLCSPAQTRLLHNFICIALLHRGGNLLESVNRCVVTVLRAGISGFVSGNGGSSLRLWVKLVLFELTRVGWEFHLVRKCKWSTALMTLRKV